MSIVDDINAISDRVLQLEQENEQLRQQQGGNNNNDQLQRIADIVAQVKPMLKGKFDYLPDYLRELVKAHDKLEKKEEGTNG